MKKISSDLTLLPFIKHTFLIVLMSVLTCLWLQAQGNWEELKVILPFQEKPQTVQVEIVDGKAIFEGDIILGDIEELRRQQEDIIRGNIYNDENRRWTNHIVPFTIHPDIPTQQRYWIMEAARQVSQQTNLTVKPRNGETNYIEFTPVTGIACYSALGMIGGKQYISLTAGCTVSIIIHEIGHAVGLYHEHNRSDRDEYINIHWENINPNYESAFYINNGQIKGDYDYMSVMHYRNTAFSINGQPTITRKDGVAEMRGYVLSPADVFSINYMYPLPNMVCADLGTLIQSDNTIQLENFSVANIGNEKATSPHISFYLSQNEHISVADPLIRNHYFINLFPSENYDYTLSYDLRENPTLEPGDYYLGAIIDAQNYSNESVESDNYCIWDEKLITLPEGYCSCTSSTTTFICENFESYHTNLGLSQQSNCWSPWSLPAGSSQDGTISTQQAFNSNKSLLIEEGSVQDVILKLGNRNSGWHLLNWEMFIPTGKAAYYNLQEDEIPAIGWNLQVYFGNPTPGTGHVHGTDIDFTYPQNQWFDIQMGFNLDSDLMILWIDNELIMVSENFSGNLGAVNFYSINSNNRYYVDNITYQEFTNFTDSPANRIADFTTTTINYENMSSVQKAKALRDNLNAEERDISREEIASSAIKITPNPATNQLYIDSELPLQQINIYDVSGRLMNSNTSPNKNIPIDNLDSGIYILEVFTDEGKSRKRFVKQ